MASWQAFPSLLPRAPLAPKTPFPKSPFPFPFKRLPRRLRRRRQREQQILHVRHAFWYISLQSLHDHDVKVTYATLFEGRKHETKKFSFSF